MRQLLSLWSGIKKVFLKMPGFFDQPWQKMKLNAEELAERRQNKRALGEQNYLWCWKHRGLW